VNWSTPAVSINHHFNNQSTSVQAIHADSSLAIIISIDLFELLAEEQQTNLIDSLLLVRKMPAFLQAVVRGTLRSLGFLVRTTGDIGRSLTPSFYREQMPHRSLLHSIFFFLVLLFWFEVVRTGTFVATNMNRIQAIDVPLCIRHTYESFPPDFKVVIDTSSGHAAIPSETSYPLPPCVRDIISLGVSWLSHSNINENGIWSSFANEFKLVKKDAQLKGMDWDRGDECMLG
jgi:hypothetical protein